MKANASELLIGEVERIPHGGLLLMKALRFRFGELKDTKTSLALKRFFKFQRTEHDLDAFVTQFEETYQFAR